MINKKEVEKSMTALEDVKGLYSQLEQAATNQTQKQEFKTILGDIEKQYQYLNQTLISLKQEDEQNAWANNPEDADAGLMNLNYPGD